MIDLFQQNNNLIREADELLVGRGLIAALEAYGKMHITGSYFLKTMTWRDLDLYVESDRLDEADFFRLGLDISRALSPGKMVYRNELVMQSGLPLGRYWGVYTNVLGPDMWKIDIWCMDAAQCRENLAFAEGMKARMDEEKRRIILEIKDRFCVHPGYKKEFISIDIYRAVLEESVGSVEEFIRWLEDRKGVRL